jgi:hypothetical protein
MENQIGNVTGSRWQIGDIVYRFNWFVNDKPDFSEYTVIEVCVKTEFDREAKTFRFSKVSYDLAPTSTNIPNDSHESEDYLISKGYASSKTEALKLHLALVQGEYDKRRKGIEDSLKELDDDLLPRLDQQRKFLQAYLCQSQD